VGRLAKKIDRGSKPAEKAEKKKRGGSVAGFRKYGGGATPGGGDGKENLGHWEFFIHLTVAYERRARTTTSRRLMGGKNSGKGTGQGSRGYYRTQGQDHHTKGYVV